MVVSISGYLFLVVGILRRSKWQGKQTETLEWIENNLEEYLEKTTFG